MEKMNNLGLKPGSLAPGHTFLITTLCYLYRKMLGDTFLLQFKKKLYYDYNK